MLYMCIYIDAYITECLSKIGHVYPVTSCPSQPTMVDQRPQLIISKSLLLVVWMT